MPPIETLRTEFTADLSPLLQAVQQGSDVLRQFAALAAGSARAVAGSFSGLGPSAGLAQGLLGAARGIAAPAQLFGPSAGLPQSASAGESGGASTTYRAGDVINTFNIQALSEAAVRSQLLPLIEQAYRRGQARPPWINR